MPGYSLMDVAGATTYNLPFIPSIWFLLAIDLSETALEVARTRSRLCRSSKFFARVLYAMPSAWYRIHINFRSEPSVEAVRTAALNSKNHRQNISICACFMVHSGISQNIRWHNMITAFIHTFFTLLEECFERISILDLVCTDLLGSDLMLVYLTQVDCHRMEHISLGLILAPDVNTRPSFSYPFPQLDSLSFYRSFPSSNFWMLGITVTELLLGHVVDAMNILRLQPFSFRLWTRVK
jgi:hypothetical protein